MLKTSGLAGVLHSQREAMDSLSNNTEDNFMKKFKYYKSNKPKPSLRDVISYEQCSKDKLNEVSSKNLIEDPRARLLGLKDPKYWQMYSFFQHPGLILIRNPFSSIGQRYWIRECLEVYQRKPNKRNIDIELDLHDWWKECYKTGTCNRLLQKKLRWTTLGYHHNWDSKVYSDDNKTPFPENLAELSDVVAKHLGHDAFKAEAAIVNYYHMNSTLSAHTDHSEVNLEAPLLSFSFGQSAIFLLGGQNKSVEPSAILLNSGDILVMSKEARLCYHAVPKILPASNAPWNEHLEPITTDLTNFKYLKNPQEVAKIANYNIDGLEWRKFSEYIKESRINMNVRQVLYKNQTRLNGVQFITS